MNSKTRPANIHQRIVEFIDGGEPFVVALVLNAAEGSTPQKAGVRAVIDGTGKIWGTIGGGFVEGQAQEYAVDTCKSVSRICSHSVSTSLRNLSAPMAFTRIFIRALNILSRRP